MAQQRKIPALTMMIVGVSVLAYCFPRISESLVYDRQAIFGGQWWRMMTAPMVHFSASHLFWDMLIFGLAGGLIETAPYRGFWRVCGLSAGLPSVLLLLMSPQCALFGGLSGLATGAAAYLCLCKARQAEKGRRPWMALFALIGVKIILEALMDAPLFVQADQVPFQVMSSAHVAGYLSAVAAMKWSGAQRTMGHDLRISAGRLRIAGGSGKAVAR